MDVRTLSRRVTVAAVASMSALAAAPTQAQAWPAKPLRFIVPFPPGGATDVLTRTIAPRLAEALGQQVVVDNRSGAGGMIGVQLTAKAPPDGYTMVLATFGPIAIANRTRFPAMPELPTIAEAGIPGFAVNNWCGVFVAGGTPPEVIARLNTELAKALALPDVRARLIEVGLEAVSNAPDAFAAYIRAETDKWACVVKDANIKVE